MRNSRETRKIIYVVFENSRGETGKCFGLRTVATQKWFWKCRTKIEANKDHSFTLQHLMSVPGFLNVRWSFQSINQLLWHPEGYIGPQWIHATTIYPVPTPPNPPNTLHQLLASLCASTSPSAFLSLEKVEVDPLHTQNHFLHWSILTKTLIIEGCVNLHVGCTAGLIDTHQLAPL